MIAATCALVVAWGIHTFVVSGAVVKNQNMSPTLKNGERVIVSKIQTTFNLVKENDMIMYRKGDHVYFGRVIAQAGQSAAFKNHQLYRDDRRIAEPYVKHNTIKQLDLSTLKGSEGDIVPPNAYFVLNDRRENNTDSRTFGFIHNDDVIGTVNVTYYPFKDFEVY